MYFIYDADSKEFVRVSKKCFYVFVMPIYEFVRSFDDDTLFFYDKSERELGFMHLESGCCIEY